MKDAVDKESKVHCLRSMLLFSVGVIGPYADAVEGGALEQGEQLLRRIFRWDETPPKVSIHAAIRFVFER